MTTPYVRKLCLHGGGKRHSGNDAPKVVFRVQDIHKTRCDLTARGVELGEVRSPAPGVAVCDGRDPDGNRFSIEGETDSAKDDHGGGP